ncbi:MAG TPA: alpha/beta fold hydrolase [Candidatus Binatia bacterium]|nr:alpha/beta fold hydrolase [Candidatus Binatia bacterium]
MQRFLIATLVAWLGCIYGCSALRPALTPPQANVSLESRRGGLRVGSLRLQPCDFRGGYYCGSLPVALDPAGRVAGKIGIALAWLPHRDRSVKASGTVVAVEGGPGYPSIESRDSYHALYAPLLDTRDLLLVDNRGTGRSGAIVCQPLQSAPVMILRAVTTCGHRLGDTSDLYGTAIAADDMAKVLDALGVRAVEIYGDSYGSFFVQAFAARHPDRVRSIVLDGAYQVTGGDPWYPSEAPTIRSAFDLACKRSPVCASLKGASLDRIRALLTTLRSERGAITPSDVAFIMDSAGLDPLTYRDLDAAARAYVDNGDRVPLKRLVNEAYYEEEGAGGRARGYSQGLFAAASCSDNPQAYDMRLQPDARKAAWQRALQQKRDLHPELYAPFTIDEFLGIPLDYAYVPLCTTWPVASSDHPAGEPVPPGTRFPSVPVLVLNGDLDTTTTPAEGDAAARLFPRATHVIVANTGHVTALGDFDGCASSIVRRFVQTHHVDGGCAAHVPAVHLVPSFSRTLDEVQAATPQAGNRATPRELRAAAAAVLGTGDVLIRSYEFGLRGGAGLRGGLFSAAPADNGTSGTLSDVRWTTDLAVSGTASFDARSAMAQAHLRLSDGVTGTIDAAWATIGGNAVAKITGKIGGHNVAATLPAP